ncbi:MAG: D-alanyl transfer protein [Bacteroidetes bacterium]|nr:D-alanyl transfer protein [Bacteroidota bacterium]
MLPFSSYEFFILMALYIGLIVLCKQIVAARFYSVVLAVLNLGYLLFVYPEPLHFLLLILFSYLITYLLSDLLKVANKLIGIVVLLLPMLLVKFDIRIATYPFVLNNLLSFAGLSYASFRIMGYYMDKAPDEKMSDALTYFNFLAFTPTLLIGPIDKFSRFKNSLEKGFSSINSTNFIAGWDALMKGIAFKYIFAELVQRYCLSVVDKESSELLPMLITMYGYYVYLFFDFAGYSLLALGIGKMMGMEVPVNFTNPFVAMNPQDFWRRFHISLGDWLRTYFFTPLYMFFTRKKGLKKYPLFRQNISLVLTFLLMGCWNGFKFNFILSGLLFGLFSAIHNTYVVQCKKKGKDVIFGNLNTTAVRIISIVITFNLVAFALYIFSGYCPFI